MRRPRLNAVLAVGLSICGATRAAAQAPRSADSAASVVGESAGAFLALSVANIDRMVGWYRDTLGFRVFSAGTAPNGTIRFALLQRGTALLEILQLPDARPRASAAPNTTQPAQIHGFFKSGFVVPDLDAAYRRVRALGVTLAYELGQPPNGPYRSFGIRDPEGNLLQFFGR